MLYEEWDDAPKNNGGPGNSGGGFVSVLESAETFADRVDATATAASKRFEEVEYIIFLDFHRLLFFSHFNPSSRCEFVMTF